MPLVPGDRVYRPATGDTGTLTTAPDTYGMCRVRWDALSTPDRPAEPLPVPLHHLRTEGT